MSRHCPQAHMRQGRQDRQPPRSRCVGGCVHVRDKKMPLLDRPSTERSRGRSRSKGSTLTVSSEQPRYFGTSPVRDRSPFLCGVVWLICHKISEPPPQRVTVVVLSQTFMIQIMAETEGGEEHGEAARPSLSIRNGQASNGIDEPELQIPCGILDEAQ